MAEKTYRDEEIRQCDCCGKHILETPLPIFYTGTIETGGIDAQGVRERVGLTMMMGGAAPLASLFAATPAAKQLDAQQFLICQPCALTEPLLAVIEAATDKQEKREAAREAARG